ncbi:response regulator [Ampullimonas aquatilis]|uniref:response regulator n=1 Tax=Ampullimonas aquatilis TaxID=1341549 RepID=UPI003C7749C4
MTDIVANNLISLLWGVVALLVLLLVGLALLCAYVFRSRQKHKGEVEYLLRYLRELDKRVASTEALERALTRDIGSMKTGIFELKEKTLTAKPLAADEIVQQEDTPEAAPAATFELDPDSILPNKTGLFNAYSAIESEDVDFRHSATEKAQAEADAALPLVMVVEDSRTAQRVAKMTLEQHGFSVILANDGLDALQKLEIELPDILITDLEMPRMGGMELISRVRSDERFANVPIVIISSVSPATLQEQMKGLRINFYLIKPYSRESLVGVVRQLLGDMVSTAPVEAGNEAQDHSQE